MISNRINMENNNRNEIKICKILMWVEVLGFWDFFL